METLFDSQMVSKRDQKGYAKVGKLNGFVENNYGASTVGAEVEGQ